MTPPASIHACALIVDEAGLLIRGASGAGKSSLVLALIAAAQAQGRFARLVADDRVLLRLAGGRILAAPHPRIAGQIEERGSGIRCMPHEGQARLTHIIDLLPQPGRLPAAEEASARLEGIEGIALIRIALVVGLPSEVAARQILAKI
jgi:serine kinase of HPr protein (carbohydrate metabolism regulator)